MSFYIAWHTRVPLTSWAIKGQDDLIRIFARKVPNVLNSLADSLLGTFG